MDQASAPLARPADGSEPGSEPGLASGAVSGAEPGAVRGLAVLGATGSIGSTTLGVVDRYPDRFRVVALAAGRAGERFAALVERYRPEVAALGHADEAEAFRRETAGRFPGTEILGGPAGLEQAAVWPGAEVVLSAIVGAAGLRPTLAALAAGRTVGLANKESLVAAGGLMTRTAAAAGARLLPVDSEHAALFQCLAGRDDRPLRLWLTASGGPFRTASAAALAAATPEQALAHPTWRMGPKVTVDSATMMNKGLELIEAHHLFRVPPEALRVVVHPQSTVHSLVEFADGSFLAQLGATDMRIPVQYALTYPERLPTDLDPLPLDRPLDLRFEPPDPERFPCLRLAREALAAGGDAPAVLNAANEVAVAGFLAGRLRFPDLPAVVEETLAGADPAEPRDLETVAAADRRARERAAAAAARRAHPPVAAAAGVLPAAGLPVAAPPAAGPPAVAAGAAS